MANELDETLAKMIEDVKWNIDWHEEKLFKFQKELAVLEAK
jgi:hypothetical protein